jgi:hypothetical protein
MKEYTSYNHPYEHTGEGTADEIPSLFDSAYTAGLHASSAIQERNLDSPLSRYSEKPILFSQQIKQQLRHLRPGGRVVRIEPAVAAADNTGFHEQLHGFSGP